MTRWRKSSYSGQESDCVEVSTSPAAIRDSKNPAVCLPVPRLETFLHSVKKGLLG
jgi:Domain of unknown function (DUF397)